MPQTTVLACFPLVFCFEIWWGCRKRKKGRTRSAPNSQVEGKEESRKWLKAFPYVNDKLGEIKGKMSDPLVAIGSLDSCECLTQVSVTLKINGKKYPSH